MLLFTEEDINQIASDVNIDDILDKYIAGIISVGKAAEVLNLNQFTVMKIAKAREQKTYIDGSGKLHDKYKPLLDDYDGMMVETPTTVCKTCAHLAKFSRPPISPTYMCTDPEGQRTTYNGKGGYGGNITIEKHRCAYWSNNYNEKMVEKPKEMQMPKEPKVRFDVSPDFVLFLDIPTIIGIKVIIPDCSIYAVTVKIYSTSDTYPAIDFKGPGKEERARECKARLDKLVSDYRKNDTKDCIDDGGGKL